METRSLGRTDLFKPCDPDSLGFETTADIERLDHIVGQSRAVEAVEFGIGISREGYNIVALGSPGTGKRSLIRQYLERQAPDEEPPEDWCYVNNFESPSKPAALRLPAGKGAEFRDDMAGMVEEARDLLSSTFESDNYRRHRQQLEEEFGQLQKQTFETLQEEARQEGLQLQMSPQGIMFTPLRDGEPMSDEEVQQLSQEERDKLEEKAEKLQKRMREVAKEAPRQQREFQKKLRDLHREVTEEAVDSVLDDLFEKYQNFSEVCEYLEAVKEDLVEKGEDIVRLQQQSETGEQQQEGMMQSPMPPEAMENALLRPYRVNLLVGHDKDGGAPIVYEDNPNYQNVIGRVEHLSQMGALVTDFNLIKPGALHKANGGYLLLDIQRLLQNPMVWEGLKRALRSQEIVIESVGQAAGMISTVSLEPQPVPLNVKVVLFGSRLLYGLLYELDPDFAELFKVVADFDVVMERDGDSQPLYSKLIGTLAAKEELRPFHKTAVARIIEQSIRIVGDQRKLSLHMRRIADLLRESDYWAGKNKHDTVQADDVVQAIESSIRRSDRIRERIQDSFKDEMILIDTQGTHVGQVNGVAVIPFGDYFFGKPTRITARVRVGSGKVVDIEREAEMSGPTHSKGVMILTGFITGRFGQHMPFSVSGSLVFEQSYSGVSGDSASSAELYALLSAIGRIPIKQNLAVTGSVNQHGMIQPVGGINEKIESFFDVCKIQGLTGEQGILIPKANVPSLMLRKDVVEAVDEGQFHVYPVETIDQGMELLTGKSAGEPIEDGKYPEDSINGLVSACLEQAAANRKEFIPLTQERTPAN